RAAMWWDGVRILASIHDLDWRSLDLPFLGAPADAAAALAAQLDYWERYIAWARTEEPQPHIDAALRWLLDNPPASGRTGLCWGDARLPNMLFRDFKVTAVLDWEMAFLGDPEADLAWWLFLDWHHSDGYDIPRLEGIPGRAETIARYQELRGEKVENLFFYDVFAALRFAAIMIRAVENMKKRGVPLPTPDFGSNNACTRRLAQLLELPPPGTAT
ncbi:MAG: phosphotransferase family protein, partial [Candidatus Binatia bacterium]